MSEALNLSWLRGRVLVHSARDFFSSSKLRVSVIFGLALLFWALMFTMFLRVFIFLNHFQSVRAILVDYLFAFFFLALLVMMTISNAIISYSSLFRSEETAFLLSLPFHAESVFAHKSLESIVFSSWGMVTLVVPMILAYGLTSTVPWYFYVISFALALAFILLPTEVGALVALLITLLIPRRKKILLIILAIASLAGGVVWLLPLLTQRSLSIFSEAGIKSVMGKIAFCQHWALPSRWVSEGMLAASQGRLSQSVFLFLLLLSNVMFVGVLVYRAGHYLYGRAWAVAHGSGSGRSFTPFGVIDQFLGAALFFLPHRLRELILKDIKTFRRDAVQWSQCLLFFGLLALYIVNIPRFGLGEIGPYWHNLVSLLNLAATCLTLSSFTTRFIFPQLSLEGRRMWVVGLMPMRRSTILWGKFFFSAVGSLLISGPLILLSDFMLGLGLWVMLVHFAVIVCVCCGLNGLAVGLGAIYPNLRTDNPSKIVSSFGGTLNLVCSIAFIMLSIAPVSAALHMHAIGVLSGNQMRMAVGIALGVEVVLGAFASLVPMIIAVRSLERMEF